MVDSGLYDAYKAALSGCSDSSARAVMVLVEKCQGAADFEKALEEGYAAVVKTFGIAAAQVALEFYVSLREASGVSTPYEPKAYPADVGNLLPYEVAQAVASTLGDSAKLADLLAAKSTQHVLEHADQTVYSNALRDPARPKWAIVPNPSACDWCLMLGSRGFEYARESTAKSARHANCRCTPVVDFDASNPALDGYDPNGLYDYYAKNLKEKWGGRRSGSSGSKSGKNGFERGKPVQGLETVDDVKRYIAGTKSMDDIDGRNKKAIRALRGICGSQKEYDDAFDEVRKVGYTRLKKLRGE